MTDVIEGVGVIVLKDHQVLLGKRKNIHGNQTWGFPGGRIESNETIQDCAKRETFEETGIALKETSTVVSTVSFHDEDNVPRITHFVVAKIRDENPKVMEPDQCQEWVWHSWNKLPSPLFEPIQELLKKGYSPL